MSTVDTDIKLYELAYLVSLQLPTEKAEKEIQKVKDIIQKNDGAISQEQAPFKRLLSYPIAKHNEALFGFLRFSMKPELVKQLPKTLRLDTNLMRFLIISISPKQLQEEQKQHYRQTPEGVKKLYKPKKEKPQEIKSEEFEKKLEEILGE